MITFDTSSVVALTNERDLHHEASREALSAEAGAGLVRRHADLRLGFSDAAVIACAEERGRRVLTLDRRHFEVVAREGTIEVLP